MPLVNDPIAADLRTLVQLGDGDPATDGAGTIGLTIDPADAQPPQWAVTVTPTGPAGQQRYLGQLAVNGVSVPGSNASLYLAAGIYETNVALDMTAYVQDPRVRPNLRPFEGYGDDRVYFYLTGPVAARNRAAEAEHCADHQYAYQHSLVLLDQALAGVAALGKVGPLATAAAADAEIVARVRQALPAALQGIAMTPAAWLAEYLRLCGQSMQRDNVGYHDFGLTLLGAQPPGNISYLTGAARDGAGVTPRYVQLTGDTTAIGVHAAATIIV